MRRGAIFGLLVTVVAVIILSSIVLLPVMTNPDNRETETICTFDTTTSTMTYHAGTWPLCSVSDNCTPNPYGKAVFIEVLYDNGTRIKSSSDNNSITIEVSPVQACNGMTILIPIIFKLQLNQSGVVSLNPATDFASYYDVHVHYTGSNYNFTAPTESDKTTLVVLSIPSGKTNTTFS